MVIIVVRGQKISCNQYSKSYQIKVLGQSAYKIIKIDYSYLAIFSFPITHT